MADEKIQYSKREDLMNKDAAIKPDEETLHTTDPQEHMKGPFSSFLNKTKDAIEENGKKDKQEIEEDRN